MRIGLVLLLCPALLLNAGLVFAAEKGGVSADDIEQICEAQLAVCLSACTRPNTPSGVLQQSFCREDCYKGYAACSASATLRGNGAGGTAAPNRGAVTTE
jgi:hypothetical protein